MESNASKHFISPEMFKKFSYSDFSLFADLEDPSAHSLPAEEDSDECSDVTAMKVQKLSETKCSPTEDNKSDAGDGDTFLSRTSSVSSADQKSYLMFKRMQSEGRKFQDETAKEKFEDIQTRVVKEQVLYLRLFETFCKKTPLPFQLDAEIKKYVHERLSYCWEEPLKYSRYYANKNVVPIISSAKTQTSLEHLYSIIQLGQVQHLTMPSLKNVHFLKRNYAKLSLKYPPKDPADNLLKMPVSKDPNASILAAKYGADVVMSLESLQTLFSNHERCLEHSWEMPVVIIENKSGTEKADHLEKVVFIDKPFLKTDMTVFEKNFLYHSLALKEALLSPKHMASVDFSKLNQPKLFTFDKKGENETETHLENSSLDLPNVPTAEEHFKPNPKDECSDLSSDSETDQLFIAEPPENLSPQKTEGDVSEDILEAAADLNTSSESGSDVRRSTRLQEKSHLQKGVSKQSSPEKKNIPKVKTPDHEDPSSFVQPPTAWNVTYQLWKIGNLKVLVRCSVTGVSKLQGKNRFWQLAPKLEYRPLYGALSLSFSEYVRQWISTAVIPNVSLARIHINAFNSKIVGCEELDLYRVIPSQYLVQISECISTTSAVLTKLISLPNGNYLLSHATNDGSLNILGEVSENERVNVSNVYDLHLKYLTANAFNLDVRPENVPWFRIDPEIQLFSHRNASSVPALFPLKVPYKFQAKKVQNMNGNGKKMKGKGKKSKGKLTKHKAANL